MLVPRETPLSLIHLENMLSVTRAGAVVLPAMPGWYHRPRRLEDLVDFVVGRVCDQFGIHNALSPQWGTLEPADLADDTRWDSNSKMELEQTHPELFEDL